MTISSAESFSRWARWLSRIMGFSALALIAIAGWGVIQTLWQPEWLVASLSTSYPQFGSVHLTTPQALAALAVLAPQIVLFIWAAYAGWVGFGHVADVTAFDAEASAWIRDAGLGLALSSLAMLLSHPALSAIISYNQPEGHRFITISMGTPELMTLLVSFVMFAFAHLIKLAADIDRDNKLIV